MSGRNEPARTLGGVPKKKFIPKVPTKRPKEDASIEAERVSAEQSESRNQRETSKKPDRQSQHRKNQLQRDRGGRGRFVMPTGQAFFTGSSSSSSSSAGGARQHIHIGVGESSSEGTPRVQVKKEGDQQTKDSQNSSNLKHDSSIPVWDQEEPDVEVAMEQEEEEKEYSHLDPVSLPLGPCSLERRLQASEKDIFASPNDPTSLEAEEQEEIFLIQLPSQIRKHVTGASSSRNSTEKEDPDASHPSRTTGKIGKIQITKSGKVFLVLDSAPPLDISDSLPSHTGRRRSKSSDSFSGIEGMMGGDEDIAGPQRYEINNGILTSFKQVVTEIAMSNVKQEGNASHSNTKGASMHVLGSITKKVVVTPDFDIGAKTSSSSTSHNGIKGESDGR